MQWGVFAFAATAIVSASAVEAASVRLTTMGSEEIDAITTGASLVGEAAFSTTGGRHMPGDDAVTQMRFSLIALADGSTEFSLIDRFGRKQIVSAPTLDESDALSFEVIGIDSTLAFTLDELAVDGVGVDGVDSFGFGSLEKARDADVAVLEGLDFTTGFAVTGVISMTSMFGNKAQDWTSMPVLRVSALDTFRTDATPAPLPTAGLLATVGLAGLMLQRRRR